NRMNNQPPSNQNPFDDSKPPSQKTPELPASQSPSSSKLAEWDLWVARKRRGHSMHLSLPSNKSSEKKSSLSAREQIASCLSMGWFSRNALTPYFSTQMALGMLQHYLAMSGRTRSR